MKTTFTLVYFDCARSLVSPAGAMNGPFTFGSKEEAQYHLAEYIRGRFLEAYLEEAIVSFYDEDSDFDGIIDIEERANLVEQKLEESPIHFEELTSVYSDAVNDDANVFEFKISEHPILSLGEAIHQADAFEVDGCFIRNFHIESDADASDDVVLDLKMVDEEYNPHEWYISNREISGAVFDSDRKYWVLPSGTTIVPFQVTPVS